MILTEQQLNQIIREEIHQMMLEEGWKDWARNMALAGTLAGAGMGAMPSTAHADGGPSKAGVEQTHEASKSVFGSGITMEEIKKAWDDDTTKRMSGEKGNPALKLVMAMHDIMGDKKFIEFMNDSGERLAKAPPGYKRAVDAIKAGKWEDDGIKADMSPDELAELAKTGFTGKQWKARVALKVLSQSGETQALRSVLGI